MRSSTMHLLLGLLIIALVALAPLALIACLVVIGAKTMGIAFNWVGILGVVVVSFVMGIAYLIVLLVVWRTVNLPRLLGRLSGRVAGTMVVGLPVFVISGLLLLAEFPRAIPPSKTVQAGNSAEGSSGSSAGAPNPAEPPKVVSFLSEQQLDDPKSLGPVIVVGKDFKPVTLPEVRPEELSGKCFALFIARRSADASGTTFEALPAARLRLGADGKIQSLASVPQGDFAEKYAHWMLKKNTLVLKDGHGLIVQAYAARATGGMSGFVTVGTDSQAAPRCRLEPIAER